MAQDNRDRDIPVDLGYTIIVNSNGIPVQLRNKIQLDSSVIALDLPDSQSTRLAVVGGGNGITELVGDGTAGPGIGTQTFTLASMGIGTGTIGDATHVARITFDDVGRITAISSVAITDVTGITALTGDGTASGSGTQAFTLATVATAATTGDASHVAQVTVDVKGRVTTATAVAISVAAAAISDSTATGRSLITATDAAGARVAIGAGNAQTANPLSQFATTTPTQLAGVLVGGVTGTGNFVQADGPTLTTPTLGVATATSINKVAFTAPATSATVAITDGKTLTVPLDATVSGTNTGDQPGGYKSKTTLTSGTAQTYTQPAGIGRIEVHGTASGGSGAGVAAASASQCTLASGGGSGGRFIKGYVRAAGSTYTYTVGAAATGGAASASAGADGNDTTFTDGTTLCTAKAGKGAPASLASAATTLFLQCGQGGATSTNGDSNYGGTGGPCGTRSGTGGSGQCISGGGGGPGGGEQRVTSGAGIAGKGPGDGGGGALGLSGASAAVGGDSFRGEIIIYEYAS